MGVWGFGAMAERPLCVGGVIFGIFQFFGGFDPHWAETGWPYR